MKRQDLSFNHFFNNSSITSKTSFANTGLMNSTRTPDLAQ